MTDYIIELLSSFIKSEKLMVFLLSATPIFEAKGGILFASSLHIDPITAYLLSLLGSSIVAIPTFFLLRPILTVMKRKRPFNRLAELIDANFQEKADKINKKKNIYRSLFVFVAIPLPFTGIWSGTVIASFCRVNCVKGLLSVLGGNAVAAGIVSLIALAFPNYAVTILNVFIWIAIGVLFGYTVRLIVKSKKRQTSK